MCDSDAFITAHVVQEQNDNRRQRGHRQSMKREMRVLAFFFVRANSGAACILSSLDVDHKGVDCGKLT